MTLAAVIPAFNEAKTIADVVRRTLPQADRVYVVNDGSTDATAAILADLPVTVIEHRDNRGKAASLVAGMRAALDAGASAVVTLDGDLQHRPEDISLLLEKNGGSQNSLVIGSRFERPGQIPALRRFANRQANFWISKACGRQIRDSQSGLRLYPRRLIENLAAGHGPDRSFVFESEILIDAARAGFAIEFVSIDPIYPAEAPRPSHYRAIRDTLRIIRMVAGKILTRDAPLARAGLVERPFESGGN